MRGTLAIDRVGCDMIGIASNEIGYAMQGNFIYSYIASNGSDKLRYQILPRYLTWLTPVYGPISRNEFPESRFWFTEEGIIPISKGTEHRFAVCGTSVYFQAYSFEDGKLQMILTNQI